MSSNSGFMMPSSTMSSRKRGYDDDGYSQYSQYGNAPTPTNADQSSSYCTCGRSSDDEEYIGCENDNCRVQWYHLSCVGLKVPPKGEWFCAECRAQGYGMKK